jgi:hypothetical protein
LTGKVTGREAHDENNKLLPPKPQTVTVEFLGKDGSVVGSQDVRVAALKAGETAPFRAEAKGAGVRAWRYRVK